MSLHERFPYQREWLGDIDRSLAETVTRWAEKEVIAKRLEHGEDFDALLVPAMRSLYVDIGLQSLVFPEEAGGSGLCDPSLAVTAAAVLEQVGVADVGLGILLANSFAVQSAIGIEPFRNNGLMNEIAAHFDFSQPVIWSLVLPQYGENDDTPTQAFHGLNAPAQIRAVDYGFVLNGKGVRPQVAGADADGFAVLCATENGEPALALVPGNAKGLTHGKTQATTGLAVSHDADITLTDVRIPASHLVFTGAPRTEEFLSMYRLCCTATITGALFSGWRILKEWGETRVIKGKGQVFKENPLTASLMGKIAGNIGIARLLTYDLARLVANRQEGAALYPTAVNISTNVAELAISALDHTMELMASAGYATEWQLERYWRDVKTVQTRLSPLPDSRITVARHAFDLQTL